MGKPIFRTGGEGDILIGVAFGAVLFLGGIEGGVLPFGVLHFRAEGFPVVVVDAAQLMVTDHLIELAG
jgi:hypothetical protein